MSQGDILIVGAGIAGLTTALALAQRGVGVQLFEQAPVLSEVGAGLQLSPNAVRVLESLGLAKALQDAAFSPRDMEVRHWRSGSMLSSEPLGDAAAQRWGAPYYHIHRADLQQLLLSELRLQRGIHLHLNAPCQAVGQGDDAASIQLANGERVTGIAVLGADGIHSVVRTQCFDSEVPRFTGHVAWRLLIPTAALPAGLVAPAASLWMGPGAHFVHYYVRGGEYVNCVCVTEQQGWEQESWTEPGELAELIATFAGWHGDIQLLISAADPGSCYRWALFDREPRQQFVDGRIALLGDACHPMLPFLAQGAAMAIEDAAALARYLHAARDVPQALESYQAQRRERVARVQLASRKNGRIYHLTGLGAALRNFALRSGLVSMQRTYSWLYGHRPG